MMFLTFAGISSTAFIKHNMTLNVDVETFNFASFFSVLFLNKTKEAKLNELHAFIAQWFHTLWKCLIIWHFKWTNSLNSVMQAQILCDGEKNGSEKNEKVKKKRQRWRKSEFIFEWKRRRGNWRKEKERMSSTWKLASFYHWKLFMIV